MPIGGHLVNKLGSGIGLATEAYQNHKNKKNAAEASKPPPEHAYSEPGSEDSEVDDDESTWGLDAASRELGGQPPPYNEVDPATPAEHSEMFSDDKNLADSFLARHPLNQIPRSSTDLPVPVIIPQRRPREADRGFVTAYPPILDEYAGINQQTFVDFLITLNKSCEYSSAFEVVNMAAFAGMFVPSITAHIVSFSVRTAAQAGGEAQSRAQRNTLLDKLNNDFFRPRGLWAIIVTWKPQSKQNRLLSLNLRSHLGNPSSAPESGQTHNMANILSTSSGTTTGQIPIDACAPLIYPQIDAAATSTTQLSAETRTKLQSSQIFISSYLDRRHQAEFGDLHRDSALSTPHASATTFQSRWADPNHPTNSGTLLGLATGGIFDPRARQRGRMAQRRAGRHGQELTEEEIHDAEMGRRDLRGRAVEQKGARGRAARVTGYHKHGVRRMVHQDVCYLMVVNYPREGL